MENYVLMTEVFCYLIGAFGVGRLVAFAIDTYSEMRSR